MIYAHIAHIINWIHSYLSI